MKKLWILLLLVLMTTTFEMATIRQTELLPASVKDITCLAMNIYHEARSEPIEGQIAVAQVTLNRVNHPSKFGSTVCEVVHEKKQFSWTLLPQKRKKILEDKSWYAATEIAKMVLTNSRPLPDLKALYYHTKQVRPYWAKNKQITAIIGNHIFYA